VRTGQTEGSVDLARLAGLEPAGVICEIMRDDGEMARMPDLEKFAEEHGLMVLTIADMIEYRLQTERLVHRRAEASIKPALIGATSEFRAYMYGSDVEDTEYLALVLGDVAGATQRGEPVLVRVQQAAMPGDMFSQNPANTEAHVRAALRQIERAGAGVFLYVHKPQHLTLTEAFEQHLLGRQPEKAAGASTPAALRDFGMGAQVLADLGLHRIRLISNNPKRIAGIGGYSIDVVERVPLEVTPASSVVPFKRAGE
jgi:3,4-dihydroxy 2-butanone 4-phosphate synthase/GTP cyclohydrolase II